MYDEQKRQRSSKEIRAEIDDLERLERQIEESNRQTMQSSIEQQNDDLTQQIIDQSMNSSMTL